MKKILLVLGLLLAGIAASPVSSHAQNTTTIQGSGAPTGACSFVLFYVDSATGNFYNCKAGAWNQVGSSSGTVSSVTCNGGLTGGTITATGTCALATSGVGATGAVLLAEQTASASAAFTFPTTFSSTYDDYLIIGNGITFSTALEMQIQFSLDGSTYDASSIYSSEILLVFGTSTAAAGTSATTAVKLRGGNTTTLAANSSVTFAIHIHNVNSTTVFKDVEGNIQLHDGSSGLISQIISGEYASQSAAKGFQVKASTGNFPAGTVRVYGLTK